MKLANPKGRTAKTTNPMRNWGYKCGCGEVNFEHFTILIG